MKKILGIMALFIVFLTLVSFGEVAVSAKGAESTVWWNFNWKHRVPIKMEERSGNTLTDYQVSVNVDTASLIAAGKMQTNCADIRFTDFDNNEIPYWIESGVNSENTTIWIKVPQITASGTETIYMYYGNPTASSASNGDDTFLFFDDFSGATLNTTKWDNLCDGSGTATIVDSKLRLDSPSGNYNHGQVRTKMSFTGDICLEHKWWLITWPVCPNTVDNNNAYTLVGNFTGDFVSIGRWRNHHCNPTLNHYDRIGTNMYINGSWQTGEYVEFGTPYDTVNYPSGRFKISRHGTNILTYYNDTVLGNWTNGFLDDSQVWFDVYGSFLFPPTTVDYDDVFVRKYTLPEPTYLTESEETFTDFSVPWNLETYHVTTVSNSTIAGFNFNQPSKQISFNVTGPSGTVGFCNITIPKTLLKAEPLENWAVTIDDSPPLSLSRTENATHASLYFTYNHSTHTVKIIGTGVIPEFPPAIIMLLFIVLTLIISIITKKKFKNMSAMRRCGASAPSSIILGNRCLACF